MAPPAWPFGVAGSDHTADADPTPGARVARTGDGEPEGETESEDKDGVGEEGESEAADPRRPRGGRRVAIDPHVHSEGSYDCSTPVERVLEAAAAAGLDAVAVTDHDTIADSLRASDLAPEYGLLAVPGVEVSTADGHLLALGVTEALEPGRSLARTAREVRERGGVAVVPHPFQRARHGARADAILAAGTAVAAIEGYNAHTVVGMRNRQATRFAARHGHPVTGGSDAHQPSLVGRAYTELRVTSPPDEPLAVSDVLDAIRAGRTAVRGGRTPVGHLVRKYARNAALKALPTR
jgi:predicted metal-dependent phosphoesterase TrpH